MGLIGKLLKTTIDVATLPVSVVADTITMGGELTDRDEPYTMQHYECRNNYFHKTCSFEIQQIKDEIKRSFAKDNNIKLLEIPYWNKNNIESILTKELNLGN